jgi:HEAT repeat protein
MFKTSNSDLVKSEIANTLGVLNYEEAVDELAEEYPYNNTVVQEAIIDMMGNIKSKNSFEFLKKIYPETQNGETMIKVIKNMYKIDKQKTNAFVKKSTNSDFDKETLAYIQNL